jgi:hypothetical protein
MDAGHDEVINATRAKACQFAGDAVLGVRA